MGFEEKLWKWYERHNNVVNAVMDIAAGFVPGGQMAFHAVKAVYGMWKDESENQDEDKIAEVQQLLTTLKPVMAEFVEDVEANEEFCYAKTVEQKKTVIKQSMEKELQTILPQISASLTISANKLANKGRTEKEVLNNKYELVSLLGSGGQGQVYCARDLEADKLVALKKLPAVLSDDMTAIETLRKEYNRVVDLLIHKNIVQYRSMAQDTKSKQWFLVMDYVPGKNMRKWLIERNNEAMEFSKACEFLLPIAEALDFAHENKVVHCDLKPENILIREDGRLILTDFGLAKEIRTSLSKRSAQGDISGTLPYMAPEQYLGRNPDARTDIWALGVMLYEITAGFHPFQGTSFEHYKDLICNVSPERIETLKLPEWEIVQAMLQKDRQQRPTKVKDALLGKSMENEPAIEKKTKFETKSGVSENKFAVLETKSGVSENKLSIPETKFSEKKPAIPETKSSEKKFTETKSAGSIPENQIKSGIKAKAGEILVPKYGSKVPAGFTFLREAIYTCGTITKTMQEFHHEETGMDFIYIPAGIFNLAPGYQVTLSPFFIARYQCTQEAWKKIMGHNPSNFFDSPRRPVEQVSWDDCQYFCKKAGFQLPTEAQWEYACRGGSAGGYCFGEEESMLGEYAWYDKNSDKETHPVGLKRPNAYGLYDMHGNVWEWCQDWYKEYPKGEFSDPTGPSTGSDRIRRGGSWHGGAVRCRSGLRAWGKPDERGTNVGFRPCARIN